MRIAVVGSGIPGLGAAWSPNRKHDDYATTLKQRRARYWSQTALVRALGFDDLLMRMRDFYMAPCEAAFRERRIGVLQLALARSGRGRR